MRIKDVLQETGRFLPLDWAGL